MTEFRDLGKREILQKYLPNQVNYSYENKTAWITTEIDGDSAHPSEEGSEDPRGILPAKACSSLPRTEFRLAFAHRPS